MIYRGPDVHRKHLQKRLLPLKIQDQAYQWSLSRGIECFQKTAKVLLESSIDLCKIIAPLIKQWVFQQSVAGLRAHRQ